MSTQSSRRCCLIVLLLTISLMGLIKGCDKDESKLPTESQQEGLALKIFANPETQAKLTGLTLDVVGLNDRGQPDVPQLPSKGISDLNLPVTVPLTLYDPPCRYRVTVTANLRRDDPRRASRVLDVCRESRLTLQLDTFEGFWIGENPLRAPESVKAGEALDVACRTDLIDAPDKDRYPLHATLREEDGRAVSGPFDVNVAVAGSFPDPYPLSAPTEQRHFICEISDGRSGPQTFTRSVTRLAATVTVTPTATPVTPTPTPVISPTETPAPPAPPPPPPPPPTNLTVAVTASPNPVPYGINTTTITITLKDSNGSLWLKPVTVDLTSISSWSEWYPSPSSLTIINGSGTITLIPADLAFITPRDVDVLVSAQVTSPEYTGNGNITVKFEGKQDLDGTLEASPDPVPYLINTTTITITLRDANTGDLLSESVEVSLAASNGNLSQSTLTVTNGSGTFTLSNDGLLMPGEQVRVSAYLMSPGYACYIRSITVTFLPPPMADLHRLLNNGRDWAGEWTDYRDSKSYSDSDWEHNCTLGQILDITEALPGTKPLYEKCRNNSGSVGGYTPVKDDCMSTDQPNEGDSDGWSIGPSLLGYVYINQVPGTIPLYRKYQNYIYNGNPSRDYMSTLDPNEIGEIADEIGTENSSGWINENKILGYIVAPMLDSCPQP